MKNEAKNDLSIRNNVKKSVDFFFPCIGCRSTVIWRNSEMRFFVNMYNTYTDNVRALAIFWIIFKSRKNKNRNPKTLKNSEKQTFGKQFFFNKWFSKLDFSGMWYRREINSKTSRDNRRNFNANMISGPWNTKQDQGRLLKSGPKELHNPLYYVYSKISFDTIFSFTKLKLLFV